MVFEYYSNNIRIPNYSLTSELNARFADIGGKAFGLEFETKADNVEILVATKNFGMLQTHSSDRVINQEFSPITAGGGKKEFTVS